MVLGQGAHAIYKCVFRGFVRWYVGVVGPYLCKWNHYICNGLVSAPTLLLKEEFLLNVENDLLNVNIPWCGVGDYNIVRWLSESNSKIQINAMHEKNQRVYTKE
ncbi:hypothetical protein AMTRI_Chr01g133840 [Amborella trichopoda]